jgi:hypothetical protein
MNITQFLYKKEKAIYKGVFKMIEIWKDIVGYEGLYQVSNFGQVKSLNYNHTGEEKILKPGKNNKGYLFVNLCKNGKVKHFLIHRLVATMFIENFLNKPYINHIDCNPKNNNVDNLEWVTQQENIQYASKLGRLQIAELGKKNNKPLIAINLTTKKETYFNSQTEAAKQLNLCPQSINYVLKNKTKKTGNYTFKYAEED